MFFLSSSSSWVNLKLFTQNQLYELPGSVLKVCVEGGGRVGGVWDGVGSEFRDLFG